MFIEMSQAGLPHLFVYPSDPKGHVEGDHRRLMPFDHEHGQPVRQLLFHHTIRETERGCKEQPRGETETKHDPDTENRNPAG
jgi:hypothetical protein